MTNKRNKKNQSDTLYHILFWIIVIAIFPISLSVWFYRTKRFDFNKQLRKIILAVFWAVVALILIIAIAVSAGKKNKENTDVSGESKTSTSAPQSGESQTSDSTSTEVEDTSELKITFLDMGQADAVLVSCDDHHLIVDSGDMSSVLSARLFELEPELKNIDYIVASTPFNESVGGFARALPYYTVGKAFCSVKDYDSEKFKDFKEALSNIELEVPRIGQTLELGSAKITFLGPNAESEEVGSVVLKIEHKDTSVLLAGSAAAADLQYLIDSGYDIDSDIMKVGAHGQEGSLSAEVIQKVSPEYAVISSGAGYGCPADETILFLSNAKVKTFRTDLQGNVTLTSNSKDGVKFEVAGDINADTTKIEGSDTPAESDSNSESTPEEGGETSPEEQTPVQEDTTAPAESTAPESSTEPAETPAQGETPAQPSDGPQEAVPDANGYTYAKKVSDNYFHRLDCPEIAGMTYPELEKYNVSRDTIINEWRTLTPCPVCNP